MHGLSSCAGSESPRQQSKRPMPLPKPTSRHVRTASQDQVKSLHVTIDSYENTGDSGNGTGDSGIYADHTWPIPQTQSMAVSVYNWLYIILMEIEQLILL